MALLDGVRLNLGGREYVVPPLNFAALRRLEHDIQTVQGLSGIPTGEAIDAVVRIAHAAISRNYPDITVEDMAELIDMGNITHVLNAVMGVSGLREGKAPAAAGTESP